MTSRTFPHPIPWGLGPGPISVHTLAGAQFAVRMWLDLMPVNEALRYERAMVEALGKTLAALPGDPSPPEMKSVEDAIRDVVEVGCNAESKNGRIGHPRPPARAA